jgi:hypothetical protein
VLNLNSRLFCPNCNAGLPDEDWNAPEMRVCSGCSARYRAVVFPALANGVRPVAPGRPVAEGDATCFYHPRKSAVVPCDRCGRFLCVLCEIEFHGERWCPACLESGQRQQSLGTLETRRVNYDSIALALATAPVLTIWASFICAPIALYVVIRYWRAPLSILPRTRIRYYIAFTLAVIEIIAWIWLIAFLWFKRPST